MSQQKGNERFPKVIVEREQPGKSKRWRLNKNMERKDVRDHEGEQDKGRGGILQKTVEGKK